MVMLLRSSWSLLFLLLILGIPFGRAAASVDDDDVTYSCPIGYKLVTIHRSAGTSRYCVLAIDRHIVTPAIPTPSEFPGPGPQGAYYHAGTCPKNLDGLPYRIGIIRHDDAELYKQDGLAKLDELQKGFYADDMDDAINSAIEYLRYGTIRYVLGVHRDSTSTTCDELPRVTKSRYDTIRSRVLSENWVLYHLIMSNCQDWASHVTRL